jgi:prepilin-type N-terminal cleavage/methylation domain-containing protein
MKRCDRAAAFTLPELLVAVALLALLLGLSWRSGGDTLARQRLEAATRRLAQGLERARAEARRLGRPCALTLGPAGWQQPAGGELPGCRTAAAPLAEPGASAGAEAAIAVQHNLPAALRFTANGLVLDGGTVVLAAAGTPLRRCLVMALPLGVVRLGRYTGEPGGPPAATACVVDEAL